MLLYLYNKCFYVRINIGQSNHHELDCINIQDERELKKQKRKQSNRESARRSRLRKQVLCNAHADILLPEFHLLSSKRILFIAFHDLIRLFQAECEELGQRAEALRSENSSLRAELERIRKEYEQLLSQNASLKVSFVCYLYIVI